MSYALAILWTAAIVLAAPIAGFLARRPLAAPQQKPRRLIYAGSAANLLVLGAITGVIDIYCGSKTIRALDWTLSLPQFVAWSLGITVASILITVAVFALRRRLNRPPSPIVMSLLPETIGEQAIFVFLCLLIGFVEEFLFRGFAFLTISGLAGSLIAGSIVTTSFALQHGIQDAIGRTRAFVLGTMLIVPVIITGSLLPSIIAHAAVDVFSGLYGRTAMASFRPK
jgi:membrane protease YdiL (CAAX protease family)